MYLLCVCACVQTRVMWHTCGGNGTICMSPLSVSNQGPKSGCQELGDKTLYLLSHFPGPKIKYYFLKNTLFWLNA